MSDAQLQTKAADVYGQNIAPTLANINKQIADTTKELESKIQTGLTDADKALLNDKLATLKTQAEQAIANTTSNYDFAQEQAGLAQQQTAATMADIQKAQLAMAAQALGMAGAANVGQGYSPLAADYQNYIRQTSAANLAALGGEGAVPAGAQVNVPGLAAAPGSTLGFGPQAGLAGLAQMTGALYKGALQGSAARAKTDIEQQRLAMEADIRQTAEAAAAKREQDQRDALTAWIMSQQGNAISVAAKMAQDLASLRAGAAGADTRTQKQKAKDELDLYAKKAAIEFRNALALQNAKADAAGLTPEQKALAEKQAYTAKGETTPLIQTGYNKIASTLSSSIPAKPLNGYTYKYVNGNIIVTGGKSPIELNPNQIVQEMAAAVGDISTKPKSEQAGLFKNWFNNTLSGSVQRQALALIYGNPKPANWSYYYDMINAPMITDTTKLPKVTTSTKSTTAKKETKKGGYPGLIPTAGEGLQSAGQAATLPIKTAAGVLGSVLFGSK